MLFSLEWCEFSWSVRNFFAAAGIDYEDVALDSVAYQRNGQGTELRAALRTMTGVPTIPQIFVNGEHVGGATETFDAFNDGSLQDRLKSSGLPEVTAINANAYSFLPKWIHPR
ncbi:glutaredoxin [Aliiroseovarius sp. KMU-50]|uniref:Glutaredoxin n=1 Tax=Aliiroseovarius salicola TaxID=3009082 RepID=A0ABT4W5K9_9RHOB|nr:glutaredoxin [Aliiroseovarius sp. KMU-50]MDA5095814.1 glutaredoxin [Aliiroseovarius sp. KMU-50]